MQINKKRLEILMTLLILTASFYIGQLGAGIVASGRMQREAGTVVENPRAVIVIDAGHGGIDVGKVGVNGSLEKEINLAIARLLKTMLEEEHITAVLTREDDAGLYDEGESNKKQQDMKRRCALIDENEPLLTVSIHQNSYPDASVKGPQVFYYENSPEGGKIAAILQESLNRELEIERPRASKGNDSYYLLRKTARPTVIVECGFLSNEQEARQLITDEYQEKVARAICDGILEYMLSQEG